MSTIEWRAGHVRSDNLWAAQMALTQLAASAARMADQIRRIKDGGDDPLPNEGLMRNAMRAETALAVLQALEQVEAGKP